MEAVSKVTLAVNGEKITAFEKITLPEEEYRQQETAMDETVQFEVTPNYAPIVVDYLVPKNTPAFDWKKVKDGTLAVDFLNGVRWTYTGVSLLKLGTLDADGKSKVVRGIELGATGKVEE